jgi:hypothetical protein
VLLKRRGREEIRKDPQLGGQWKVPSLVALGMFQTWWSIWKHLCLVAIGRKNISIFFTSYFSP